MIAQLHVARVPTVDNPRILYNKTFSSKTKSVGQKRRSEVISARRAEKREQEDKMRSMLRKHASVPHLSPFPSSDASLGIASSTSNESMESATSRQSQLLSMLGQTSFRHLRVLVTFEFGLLTSEGGAPPQGPYETLRPTISEEGIDNDGSELRNKSEILFKILGQAGAVSANALEQRSGNVLMFVSPERSSFITFVRRDYNYQSPENRPGIVRCLVSAVMPISIASDSGTFTETSKIMARVIVRKALIESIQKKQLFA